MQLGHIDVRRSVMAAQAQDLGSWMLEPIGADEVDVGGGLQNVADPEHMALAAGASDRPPVPNRNRLRIQIAEA